jgi:hypothetical protein
MLYLPKGANNVSKNVPKGANNSMKYLQNGASYGIMPLLEYVEVHLWNELLCKN